MNDLPAKMYQNPGLDDDAEIKVLAARLHEHVLVHKSWHSVESCLMYPIRVIVMTGKPDPEPASDWVGRRLISLVSDNWPEPSVAEGKCAVRGGHCWFDVTPGYATYAGAPPGPRHERCRHCPKERRATWREPWVWNDE